MEMFFVKGNFLLLRQTPNLVEAIDQDRLFRRGETINIVPFTSREEAEKFVSMLVESLSMEIQKRVDRNGITEWLLENMILGVNLRYEIIVYEVIPVSSESWWEAITAAAKYIKNGWH